MLCISGGGLSHARGSRRGTSGGFQTAGAGGRNGGPGPGGGRAATVSRRAGGASVGRRARGGDVAGDARVAVATPLRARSNRRRRGGGTDCLGGGPRGGVGR